uniref:YqaJ viral recombinase domain-containing protein n=1 Tax=Amphimedon queenslandica TaxID=400682 RepID=A0A1X7TTG2_AMPQE
MEDNKKRRKTKDNKNFKKWRLEQCMDSSFEMKDMSSSKMPETQSSCVSSGDDDFISYEDGPVQEKSHNQESLMVPNKLIVEQSSSTTHSSSTPSISPDITSLPSSSSLTPPHHNVSATLSQSDHFSTGLASLPSPKQPSKTINPPTDAEIQKLYSSLAKCKSKPAILSLTRDYSSSYIPISLSPDLPSPLSALYNSEYLSSHYIELLSLAEDLEISITEGQCLAVEKSTKTQFQSRIWYNMRAGRITASRLRAVCTADEAMPPLSLIMSICYPDVARFNSHATEWGCKHEDEARQRYSLQLNSTHDGLTITKSGLFINHASPFLGASPDALVDCLCCGSGICEIKVCDQLVTYY